MYKTGDSIKFRNVLREVHEGVVVKINKRTVRVQQVGTYKEFCVNKKDILI